MKLGQVKTSHEPTEHATFQTCAPHFHSIPTIVTQAFSIMVSKGSNRVGQNLRRASCSCISPSSSRPAETSHGPTEHATFQTCVPHLGPMSTTGTQAMSIMVSKGSNSIVRNTVSASGPMHLSIFGQEARMSQHKLAKLMISNTARRTQVRCFTMSPFVIQCSVKREAILVSRTKRAHHLPTPLGSMASGQDVTNDFARHIIPNMTHCTHVQSDLLSVYYDTLQHHEGSNPSVQNQTSSSSSINLNLMASGQDVRKTSPLFGFTASGQDVYTKSPHSPSGHRWRDVQNNFFNKTKSTSSMSGTSGAVFSNTISHSIQFLSLSPYGICGGMSPGPNFYINFNFYSFFPQRLNLTSVARCPAITISMSSTGYPSWLVPVAWYTTPGFFQFTSDSHFFTWNQWRGIRDPKPLFTIELKILRSDISGEMSRKYYHSIRLRNPILFRRGTSRAVFTRHHFTFESINFLLLAPAARCPDNLPYFQIIHLSCRHRWRGDQYGKTFKNIQSTPNRRQVQNRLNRKPSTSVAGDLNIHWSATVARCLTFEHSSPKFSFRFTNLEPAPVARCLIQQKFNTFNQIRNQGQFQNSLNSKFTDIGGGCRHREQQLSATVARCLHFRGSPSLRDSIPNPHFQISTSGAVSSIAEQSTQFGTCVHGKSGTN